MSTAQIPTQSIRPEYSTADHLRSWIASVLTFLLFLITTILVIPLVILSFGKLTNLLVVHVGAWIGRMMLLFFGVRLKYDYSRYKPDRPAVFITNHSSTLDLFAIIAMKLPNVRYVAKKELQYNPVFFLLGRITGQIFIDRSRSKETIQRLQKTYDYIRRKNLSLLVAPEGSRKHKGMVGPFKKGAFYIARDLGYSVVPVYIDGAYPLAPGSSMVTKPGTITLRYFPPVEVSNWDDKEMHRGMESVRELYREQYAETFREAGYPAEGLKEIVVK